MGLVGGEVRREIGLVGLLREVPAEVGLVHIRGVALIAVVGFVLSVILCNLGFSWYFPMVFGNSMQFLARSIQSTSKF